MIGPIDNYADSFPQPCNSSGPIMGRPHTCNEELTVGESGPLPDAVVLSAGPGRPVRLYTLRGGQRLPSTGRVHPLGVCPKPSG